MRQEIKIGNRIIGPGQPIFITAEIGVTCNYDMKISKGLIDVAAEAGADAIKFLLVFPEEFMSDRETTYTYDTLEGRETVNMFEMFKEGSFTLDEWLELKAYADKKGIIMFATVPSSTGLEYAKKMNLDAIKIASWDLNHHPLWRKIARLGKPMIIDTGPVDTLDVAKVIKIMQEEGNDQSLLVHCIHTDNPEEINMRSIPYMRQAFNSLVGYSSREREHITDIMAVTLGADFLEKRLTLGRDLPGHHHVLSMEPDEFKDWVGMIRDTQASLGVFDLLPSKADREERKKWFRHVVANRDIPAGTVLTEEHLEGKRPENGISPEYMNLLIGRRLKRDLKENEAVNWEDV